MGKGKIILLNGVSSSGKTTLVKALQNRLEEPYFSLSSDMYQRDMIPDKFTNYRGSHYRHETHLTLFLKSMSVFHHTIRLFSDMECHTVVDHIFLERHRTLEECVQLLHGYPVLFVHVTCPLEEIRRREKERGDRFIGQGEEQISLLCPQGTYDLAVDTCRNSPNECADRIIELLKYPEKF